MRGGACEGEGCEFTLDHAVGGAAAVGLTVVLVDGLRSAALRRVSDPTDAEVGFLVGRTYNKWFFSTVCLRKLGH